MRVGCDDCGGMNAWRRFRPKHLFESDTEAGESDRWFFKKQEELVGLGLAEVVERE